MDWSGVPGVRQGADRLEIRGADGGWHVWHGRKTAYPHANVTWLLNRATRTGPEDALMGLGTEPLLLTPSEIEARALAYCREYQPDVLRERLAGHERVVAHETAVLMALRKAVAMLR
jgi:hypothetical protein